MPGITALLHTHNDALRLGRALEMLFPCDEILIVDHDSTDGTDQVARDYGAKMVSARAGVSPLSVASTDWILSLDPRESITESLAASLFEWKSKSIPADIRSYSVFRREETPEGWIQNPVAQTRLVRADWKRWAGNFPQRDESAVALEGELLCFSFP